MFLCMTPESSPLLQCTWGNPKLPSAVSAGNTSSPRFTGWHFSILKGSVVGFPE